jgi:hypothetical protein
MRGGYPLPALESAVVDPVGPHQRGAERDLGFLLFPAQPGSGTGEMQSNAVLPGGWPRGLQSGAQGRGVFSSEVRVN